MKLAARVWLIAALFAVAALGLFAPGVTGEIGIYCWLGVFPGMAAIRFLLPDASNSTRWTLGLALSPLVSSIAGWALLASGVDLLTASRIVGIAGWVLFSGGEARAQFREVDEPGTNGRFPWAWSLACAAFVALPAAVDPWVRIRSDTWIHVALVREITQHGIPPMDPRFIGMHLNYVWFYNLFLAQLTVVRGQEPFVFIPILNTVLIAVLVWAVWKLAWEIWGTERAAKGTVMLMTLGMNAGAWLLWPLNLLRVPVGRVVGMAEVRRVLFNTRFAGTDVIYQLSAPFAQMVNFWDKYTLGTAIGYAYLLVVVMWWALARWLAGAGARWLALAALAAAGQQLFHGVVGMSVIPVATGALVLAALLRGKFAWMPAPARLAVFGGAMLAGFAACISYTRAISAGWDSSKSGLHHSFFHFGWQMPWTLATSCAIAAPLAWRALRRAGAEQRGMAGWLACWALGMTVFALVVHLPESNESKFVWPLFAALSFLGGAAFLDALDAARRRFGRTAAAIGFGLLFVVPLALYLQGFLFDPAVHTAEALNLAPGEDRLYAWMRDSTRTDVAFIDNHNRDLINVYGRRRLLAGTAFGSDRAAFPAADLARRRAITADLFGPVADFGDDLAGLADAVARARAVHSQSDVLVLYRPRDFAPGVAPWLRLEQQAGPRASLRYDRDGFRVYALKLD